VLKLPADMPMFICTSRCAWMPVADCKVERGLRLALRRRLARRTWSTNWPGTTRNSAPIPRPGRQPVSRLAYGEDSRARHPVASCPCDDRNLHFFLRRDPEDPVAMRLFDTGVKPGDAVTVWGPYGEFTLAEGSQPLVFVACDHGFAPVKSLIEHALSLDAAPSIDLFWLATRADGHFLANQCRAWSAALDPFEYNLFSDSDPASGALQVAAAMRADVFQIDCAFYLAGPLDFVLTVRAQLAEAGVPEGQIRMEVMP
jgi:CDP-4-dehydro-6-deoxyglucose reductase